MSRKPNARPAVAAAALPIAAALAESLPLGRLSERLRRSQACFEAVTALLPPALLPHVRPGPLDEAGWSLLAANAAVAAKLRQLQPHLAAALAEAGEAVAAIRIKVLPRTVA